MQSLVLSPMKRSTVSSFPRVSSPLFFYLFFFLSSSYYIALRLNKATDKLHFAVLGLVGVSIVDSSNNFAVCFSMLFRPALNWLTNSIVGHETSRWVTKVGPLVSLAQFPLHVCTYGLSIICNVIKSASRGSCSIYTLETADNRSDS